MTEYQRSKPKLSRALLSFPLAANSICGWMLFACFWMPFGVGCDKQTVLFPSSGMADGWPVEPGDVVGFLYFNWPFFFGAAFAVLLLLVAVLRPVRFYLWLLPVPVLILILLLLLGVLSLFISADTSGERVVVGAVFVSPPAVALLWCGSAMWKRRILLATTRSICGLALIMPLTLYGLGFFSFVSRFLIGFYLAVATSLTLTITSWSLYTAGEQVFSDENLPRRKVQFRIRTMMAWTLLVAGVSAVVQHLIE